MKTVTSTVLFIMCLFLAGCSDSNNGANSNRNQSTQPLAPAPQPVVPTPVPVAPQPAPQPTPTPVPTPINNPISPNSIDSFIGADSGYMRQNQVVLTYGNLGLVLDSNFNYYLFLNSLQNLYKQGLWLYSNQQSLSFNGLGNASINGDCLTIVTNQNVGNGFQVLIPVNSTVQFCKATNQ